MKDVIFTKVLGTVPATQVTIRKYGDGTRSFVDVNGREFRFPRQDAADFIARLFEALRAVA
jgi:hypothetical protein